jgi:hypothetical protein
LWGGVRGGGGCYGALNFRQHAFDIRQYIVVPESQDAIATRFKNMSPFCIRSGHRSMLAAIDLHNQSRGVTGEINNIPFDPNLPTKMRIGDS